MKYLKVVVPVLLFIISVALELKYAYNTCYDVDPIPEIYRYFITGFFGLFFLIMGIDNAKKLDSL